MVFRLGVSFTNHVSAVTGIGITDQRNWMHASAKAPGPYAHVYSFPFALLSAAQTSPEMVILGCVGASEISRVIRKKTSFSLVCMNVLHQVDKKALSSRSDLQTR